MRLVSLVALVVSCACGTPLPERDSPSTAPQALRLAAFPSADLQAVWPVSRFRVGGSALSAADALIIEGELGEYHVRRVRDRDLPKTLVERLVPASAWLDGQDVVLAPEAPLAVGGAYTVGILGAGVAGTVRVTAQAPPLLPRLWPPSGAEGGSEHVVFCGDAAPAQPQEIATFEPGQRAADVVLEEGLSVALGVPCLLLRLREAAVPGERLVPPVVVGEVSLEPTALVPIAPTPLTAANCGSQELAFGPACATVLDDRMLLRSPPAFGLWLLTGAGPPQAHVTEPEELLVVGGLAPSSIWTLQGEYRDLAANERKWTAKIETAAAIAHVVLNEVLANPLGAEPQQEWVELTNDGTTAVDLGGWRLADSAGETLLPKFSLAPGAFVVIARDDFDESGGGDVPVAMGASVLRVPSLGKNGLSNAGEQLVLRRPDGTVASTAPATPKPKPGVSVARRSPEAVDQDASAFAWHADPGASPGAPNVTEPERER